MEVKSIYGKVQAHFEKDGTLTIPGDIRDCAPGDAPLLTREWLVLIFLTAKNKPEGMRIPPVIAGERGTLWRTIKSLKRKGYLPD